MNSLATHPSRDVLAAFVQGLLDEPQRLTIELHVAKCDTCCAELLRVPDDSLVERLRRGATPHPAAASLETAAHKVARPAAQPPKELADHPRYRIVKLLGVGGMGVVYQAEHRLMQRPVAIKVVEPRLVRHPRAVERFRREVRAAARLTHPNIVAAHDAEQAGDTHFLVMEYVPGVSLARLVEQRGPLPIVHAANYIRQAALGLQHADQHGMVHRDIKPQNLMLTPNGQIKVLDFGLARFASEQDQADVAEGGGAERSAEDLTMDGTIVGTPDYIAPEQIQDSRQADIRADIYSLGCTLYLLLTGSSPFPTGTVSQKLTAHRTRTPRSIRELRPEVPPELCALVERMMAKSPGDRFSTPAEVVKALAPWAKPNASRGSASAAAPVAAAPVAPPPLTATSPVVASPLAAEPTPTVPASAFPDSILAEARPSRLPPLVSPVPITASSGGWISLARLDRRYQLIGGLIAAMATIGLLFGAVLYFMPSTSIRAHALIVVPRRGFDAMEVETIRRELTGAGVDVAISSSTTDPLASPGPTAVTLRPSVLLADVDLADFDAIIFCTGNVREVFDQQRVTPRSLLESTPDKVHRAGQELIVGASGDGLSVLLGTTLFRDQRVTCPPDKVAAMRQMAASGYANAPREVVADEPVVRSGRLVTAQGPKEARAFAAELIRALKSR